MRNLILTSLALFLGACVSVNSQHLKTDDLTVRDDATITDDASVGGDLTVTGNGSFGTMTLPASLDVEELDFSGDASRGFSLLIGDNTDADWYLAQISLLAEQHTIFWNDANDQWEFQRGIDIGGNIFDSAGMTISGANGIDFEATSGNQDLITLAQSGTPKLQFIDSLQDFWRFQQGDGYVFSTGTNGDITETLDSNVVEVVADFHTESGSTREGGIGITSHTNSNDSGNKLFFFRSNGSHTTQTVVADNDYLGGITFAGYDGADFHTGAFIRAQVDGTVASDDVPGELIFGTGDGLVQTERMYIKPDGNFQYHGLNSATGDTFSLFGDSSNELIRFSESSYGGAIRLYEDGVTSVRWIADIDSADDGFLTMTEGAGIESIHIDSGDGINLTDNVAMKYGKAEITLGAAATTFAASGSFAVITGDAGTNTIATITSSADNEGQILRLLFVDGLVTITDDNSHAANSVDLSAAFTSADDTVLTLIHDGTSWYEVSRSVN